MAFSHRGNPMIDLAALFQPKGLGDSALKPRPPPPLGRFRERSRTSGRLGRARGGAGGGERALPLPPAAPLGASRAGRLEAEAPLAPSRRPLGSFRLPLRAASFVSAAARLFPRGPAARSAVPAAWRALGAFRERSAVSVRGRARSALAPWLALLSRPLPACRRAGSACVCE